MTDRARPVVLVAAHARNRVIGNGPDIPWRLPGEQAQFKELTWGHTLLMGRTTFESIGRPLPGRTTIVLTRHAGTGPTRGCWSRTPSRRRSTSPRSSAGDLMVAGGGEVYAALLPYATHQVLTEVDLEPDGRRALPAVRRRGLGGDRPRELRRLRARLARADGPRSMKLAVDPTSGVPPFEQVREAIRGQVDAGVLEPGFRLPPVRVLAAELDLATNTVARAYKELEALGVVETRGRAGTFVSGRGVERSLREAAASYAATVRTLGRHPTTTRSRPYAVRSP